MKKPLKVDLNQLKIDQYGFVFKDIDKQAEIMEKIYNIPKFNVSEHKDLEIQYRGKKSIISQRIALSRLGNIQLELIEHEEGNSIYQEFLDAGREGFHHISYFIDDLDYYIKDFIDAGFEIIHSGLYWRQNVAYFDTEETFGMLMEFQETIKRKKKKD
jgi:methylmalonyl-CoA/ethylmalonyl-CoA epimerase